MFSLEELFCSVDDFCIRFEPGWKQQLLTKGKCRFRNRRLSLSEIMTIEIAFHLSAYKNFKTFYLEVVRVYWCEAFPNLVSYNRFVEWQPDTLIPLMAYLRSCFGASTGIGFIDSTSIKVCDNRRIQQHRVFKAIAKRGKTSVDWFYGFKLHLAINHRGELLNIALTTGNIDDRQPVRELLKGQFGQFFGDKGYISAALAADLRNSGIILVTKLKKRMKNKLMTMLDKQLLRKRAIVESVIEQLKHISQIEHSRHRSPTNFVVNLLAGLIAYCYRSKKPSIAVDDFVLSASA
jgi:hypothetical protein